MFGMHDYNLMIWCLIICIMNDFVNFPTYVKWLGCIIGTNHDKDSIKLCLLCVYHEKNEEFDACIGIICS